MNQNTPSVDEQPESRRRPATQFSSIRVEWLQTFTAVADVEPSDDALTDRSAQHVAELENRCETVLLDDESALTVAGMTLLPAARSLLESIADFESFGRQHQPLRDDLDIPPITRWADADLATVRRDIEDLIRRIEMILAHG